MANTESVKFNKRQGLIARLGINPLGLMSVPVSDLVEKMEDLAIDSEKLNMNDLCFPASWSQKATVYKNYTDKNFTFCYDYDRSIKSDIYCLKFGNTVKYYSNKAYEKRFILGNNLKVCKTTEIVTANYIIYITIGISMIRGNIDLLVKSHADSNGEQLTLLDEKNVYFKSVTSEGLKKEVQKYVFNKLGS